MLRVLCVVGAALALVVVGVVLTSCGDGGGVVNPEGSAPDAGALCTSLQAAKAGDGDRARAAFMDDAHEPLHELARELESIDRAEAARLLEAKQRVESAIERDALSSADLEPLVKVVDTSLRSLARDGLACAART